MADQPFRIRLAPKNEGVEYVDEVDTYRFNVALRNGMWTVELPPSTLRPGTFTEECSSVITARIRDFLASVRWFGIFPRTYRVEFVAGKPSERRDYSIGLAPDKKSLRYGDEFGKYRFVVRRSSRGWVVDLPPSYEQESRPIPFTSEERARILPRVSSYLSHGVRAGFFPIKLQVEFIEDSIGATMS